MKIISFASAFLGALIAFTNLATIRYYIFNINNPLRRRFWGVIALFLLALVLIPNYSIIRGSYKVEWIIINALVVFICLYLMRYLHVLHGEQAIYKGKMQKEKDDLVNQFLPFAMSNYVGSNRGYEFDIDAYFKTLTDEYKELSKGLFIRKYKGELKYNSFFALEFYSTEKVDFPKQFHKYNEFFDVLKGSVELKENLKILAGGTGVVFENQTHYFCLPAGTKGISYFTRSNITEK